MGRGLRDDWAICLKVWCDHAAEETVENYGLVDCGAIWHSRGYNKISCESSQV